MTSAIVLIEAEGQSMADLGPRLADVDGVTEAFTVAGEWDFVVVVRVPGQEQIAEVITKSIAPMPGVAKTQTLMAFEVFSKHDLEAMFSVGE